MTVSTPHTSESRIRIKRLDSSLYLKSQISIVRALVRVPTGWTDLTHKTWMWQTFPTPKFTDE